MERLPARMEREHLEYLLRTTLDWELWRDNRHVLPGRVQKAVKRGEVRQLSRIQEYLPGLAEVYVRRLKPRPPRWRRLLIAAGAALGVSATLVLVLYLLVQVLAVALLPALVVLDVVWLLFHFVSEHEDGCKGWHCPGCRG